MEPVNEKPNCQLTYEEVKGLMEYLDNEFIAPEFKIARETVKKMCEYLDSLGIEDE